MPSRSTPPLPPSRQSSAKRQQSSNSPAAITTGKASRRRTKKAGESRRFRNESASQRVTGLPVGRLTRIEASLMVSPPWNPRGTAVFSDDEIVGLIRDVHARGGNLVPVTVRPAPDVAEQSNADQPSVRKYEIVTGSRRVQACAAAGLPVVAQVLRLDDREAIQRLHAENIHRKGWSAFERGVFYARLLDEKVYESAIELARDLTVDPGDVSRAVSLARLPAALLEVLADRNALALHDAHRFSRALRAGQDDAVRRAREAYEARGTMSPRILLEALEHDGQVADSVTDGARRIPLVAGESEVGVADINRDGELTLTIRRQPPGCSAEACRAAMVRAVTRAWLELSGEATSA